MWEQREQRLSSERAASDQWFPYDIDALASLSHQLLYLLPLSGLASLGLASSLAAGVPVSSPSWTLIAACVPSGQDADKAREKEKNKTHIYIHIYIYSFCFHFHSQLRNLETVVLPCAYVISHSFYTPGNKAICWRPRRS